MDPVAIAIIIFLGGCFLTAWIVNAIGSSWESNIQTLSHRWMQWPQKMMMYGGFVVFFLIAVNYYLTNEYNQNVFDLLKDIPFLGEISEGIRWFMGNIRGELGSLFQFLPSEMPFLTIILVLFFGFILLSLFHIKGLQRLLFLLAIGAFLYIVLVPKSNEVISNQNQVTKVKKKNRPAWATD